MIYHGDTETPSKLLHEGLTEGVIGAAIEVHRALGHVLPVHEAQLLTYLKMNGKRVGLILNFNSSVLTRGGIIKKGFITPCLRGEVEFGELGTSLR